ncbi:MAG: amino acid permease [Thaumarchaeota archaeon]|nr:amino acid permease [Nitrososphaerota archaeon]
MSRTPEENSSELKREVGTWGSFSMGYADVGADIYVVLGVIALFAGLLSPLAFLVAAVVYVSTGLCYAELATRYPVAGGGHYFSLKAFGPFHGFVAGWGLMLSYTVDIALFALATVGYLQVVVGPFLKGISLILPPYYALVSIALVILLLILNLLGIRYSSKLNELIVAVDIVTVALFMVFGLPSIIASGALAGWLSSLPAIVASGSLGGSANWSTFVVALSLATVSYIGIESISQAAEETKNPARVIPRATKAAIFAVVTVAIVLSLLSVTLGPLQAVSGNTSSPAWSLAQYIPYIGPYFAVWVAVMGTLVCYISTNTGVIGVSRVTFSMSRLGLMPKAFARISYRFRTPYLTLILFTSVACLLLLLGVELSTFEILPLIASVYNFGALIAYFYVNAAAIVLRFKEPAHEGWKMPLNVTIHRGGVPYKVSVIPFIGIAFTAIIWSILVATNPGGRLAGTAWFAIGIAGYLIYQKWKGGKKSDG